VLASERRSKVGDQQAIVYEPLPIGASKEGKRCSLRGRFVVAIGTVFTHLCSFTRTIGAHGLGTSDDIEVAAS
jgi:hypothetical protein